MRAPRRLGLCLAAIVSAAETSSPVPLPHEAYIWQRAWRQAVCEAVTSAAPRLAGFVILAAELGPTGLARPVPDYQALTATGRPIGLALRIGAGAATDSVPTLAAQLLAEAASNHLAVAELQLDYDCPESKLDAYRDLVVAVRRRIAPQRLTITALPAWLRQPAFPDLVAATDGFVLQVHALDAGLSLCDPAAARAAVARANLCGQPFRVALPTHAYVVGVDPDGKLLACDALVGFARSERAPDTAATRFAGNPRLAPGESRTIAWLRFHKAEEIHCEARLE